MIRYRSAIIAAALLCAASSSFAQSKAKAQNVPEIPYDSVPNFFKMPPNIYFGEGIGVATNSKGHVFVYTRTGETRLFEFDQNGTFVRELGQGLYGLVFAHAVRVDKDDNVWVVDEGQRRHQVRVAVRIPFREHHQSIGILVRQRIEQDRLDDAEDRGVGPDAEDERQKSDRGVRGLPEERADRVPEIAKQVAHNESVNQMPVKFFPCAWGPTPRGTYADASSRLHRPLLSVAAGALSFSTHSTCPAHVTYPTYSTDSITRSPPVLVPIRPASAGRSRRPA